MSTIKVNKIEATATANGGIAIDSSGHVQVDGNQLPTAGPLSNRNLITNGAMQVAQRGTSATVADNSNEGYSTLDQWAIYYNSSMSGAVTFSQSTDAPSGFATSAKLQCSTTNTSISGNQYLKLVNKIEAQNCQLLNYGSSGAKSSILSWYMKTDTYTGPVSVSLEIEGGQEYFTVSVTPTTSWARYTLAIPGSTSQAINNDNGEGLTLHFALAGSTSSSNAASSDSTAWSSTRSDYRDNIGNLLSSTSNAFYVTGVQLEVGEKATPFEHRSYGDELARCQRYFYAYELLGVTLVGGNTALCNGSVYFPVEMRAAPTLTSSSVDRMTNIGEANHNGTYTFGSNIVEKTHCAINYSRSSGDTWNQGTPLSINDTGGSTIMNITAEL